MEDVIKSESPDFDLIIPETLEVVLVGSLTQGVQYSMGANESGCFLNDELILDVLIHEKSIPNSINLRDKVVKILRLRNKDIRLIDSSESGNTKSLFLHQRATPVLECLDFNF